MATLWNAIEDHLNSEGYVQIHVEEDDESEYAVFVNAVGSRIRIALTFGDADLEEMDMARDDLAIMRKRWHPRKK